MPVMKMEHSNQKVKNSSVELLRTLAMLFIVLSHACVHSNFNLIESGMTLHKLCVQWGVLGNLGVDIFLLISGYYLCYKKENTASVLKLLLQVWFYSWLLFAVCRFVFDYPYTVEAYLRVFFPTVFREYWFFTAYIALVLLCPYINRALDTLNREQFENLIAVMLVLWVIIPAATFYTMNMYGDVLAQFVLFYVIGAYFRRHPGRFHKKRIRICMVIGSFLCLFASTFVLDWLGERMPFFANKGTLYYGRNSFLILFCAVGLFTTAIYAKAFYNRAINLLGSCTFGVYLIHDNPAVRNILWLQLLNHARYFTSPSFLVRMGVSVVLVFAASAFLEYLRITFVEKRILQLATKLLVRLKTGTNNSHQI